jgi:methionine-S-sulfoxide reductase
LKPALVGARTSGMHARRRLSSPPAPLLAFALAALSAGAVLASALAAGACGSGATATPAGPSPDRPAAGEVGAPAEGTVVVDRVVARVEADGRPSTELAPPPPGFSVATFAGGCFWCMEAPFDRVPGVVATISGYTGGGEPSPTYEEVGRGRTGHCEAVRVIFDPTQVTYEQLLEVYWRQIDPTQVDGQFADEGRQYRTAIFVHDAAQREAAERSKRAIAASGRFSRPIVVAIEDAGPFYRAEEYHQDSYRKNPAHYQRYRRGSGREGFLERVWGDAH